ncbi:MAG: hypothetical protein HQ483_17895 [Rhodospirillales bacterium]|nr:hypothetical protein [Rhodospirillales bacterium]
MKSDESLGAAYFSGNGVERNIAKSIVLLNKAYNNKSESAGFLLTVIHLTEPAHKNYQRALEIVQNYSNNPASKELYTAARQSR